MKVKCKGGDFMEVLTINPRGFCHGVIRAVEIVERAVLDRSVPKPIHVLGMIVHNRHVVDDLSLLSVITLYPKSGNYSELLDSINTGTVVITAHGIDERIIKKAKDKGLYVIDATCPFVHKSKHHLAKWLSKGYVVAYIGKQGHPEALSALSLSDDIFLIENGQDVDKLPENTQKLYVTTQTTCSQNDVSSIMETIAKKYPNAIFEDEICNATARRQDALIAANKEIDLCVVVGDPSSNNTRNLFKISKEITNTRTIMVNDVSEIDPSFLKDVKRISVTSGASTPDRVTDSIIAFLRSYDQHD